MLDGFKVKENLEVRWGDMDAFGHVNNTLYFKYFESMRIHYFEKLNFYMGDAGGNFQPIIAATSCHFKRPIVYPEKIDVYARVSKIGNTSLTMEMAITLKDTDTICATGDCVVVMFDYKKMTKVAIPLEFKKLIEELEGKSF